MPAPDYFEFVGLPRKLNLDQADLQRRFYALSRELHPDRFSRATPAERERALLFRVICLARWARRWGVRTD